MDYCKPDYNILTTAGSSLGYKHTPEGQAKISARMKGKRRSDDTRKEMSSRQQGEGNTFYGKSHTEKAKRLLR
jgi:group I intron endonuclease